MLKPPVRPEIDHHTLRFLVGAIALTLAPLTDLFAPDRLTSISSAYHSGGWSESILVGFLFATSAFLLAYNGKTRVEMPLSKVAALCGLLVALFPSKHPGYVERIPYVHTIAAAFMFLILAFFCYSFARTARVKPHHEARVRLSIYWICGTAIVLSVATLAVDHLAGGPLDKRLAGRLTYFGEYVALVAFGASWLTASRMLPVITDRTERLGPLGSPANAA